MNITTSTLSIITGATGGLGKSISESILANGGKLVFIAREQQKINLFEKNLNQKERDSFFALKADLSINTDINNIEKELIKILKSSSDVDEVFLFNNASTIDPIALIGEVSYEEILTSLSINIASAYALVGILLRLKLLYNIPKVNIINISSGVSINAVTGWSSYCISKAGLNMLTKCIASENSSNGVFSVSVNPGPINTEMQEKIRKADFEKIPAAKKFGDMYSEGKLQSASAVTEKLFRILTSNEFSTGDFIDFNKIN